MISELWNDLSDVSEEFSEMLNRRYKLFYFGIGISVFGILAGCQVASMLVFVCTYWLVIRAISVMHIAWIPLILLGLVCAFIVPVYYITTGLRMWESLIAICVYWLILRTTTGLSMTWPAIFITVLVCAYSIVLEPEFWRQFMEVFARKTDHWSAERLVRQSYVRNKIFYAVVFPFEFFLIPALFLGSLFPVWGRAIAGFGKWLVFNTSDVNRGVASAYILGTSVWFGLEFWGVHPRVGFTTAFVIFLLTELIWSRIVHVTWKSVFFWLTGFVAVFWYLPWLAPIVEESTRLSMQLAGGDDSVLAEQTEASLRNTKAIVPMLIVFGLQTYLTRGWLLIQWQRFKGLFDVQLTEFPC